MVESDTEELRGFTTGTHLTGLAHTMVTLGNIVAQWARNTPGVDPQRV